ncbi:MAG: exodeoxyribonuclease III [Nitriliruptoraceae bacterium]
MRLVTWNVNSLRARLPRVVELLTTHRPDVVCVQETKVASETFPHAALAEHGYTAFEVSEGRWNGVALLVPTGTEVTDVVDVLPGAPDPGEARWVEATIAGVRVASVYVPNGRDREHPMFAVKLRFLEAMRTHLAELVAVGPVVVAGDVNIAPEDRDVWDVAQARLTTHITPAERQRLAAFGELGLQDAFRTVDPDGEGFTWWDYRLRSFQRGFGMRIDLALVSSHLAVTGCTVERTFRLPNEAGDKPSDHAPLVVDLER